MKNLIIVGARGWGREVYRLATTCAAYRRGEFVVKGFLDSDSRLFDDLRNNYPPILGDVETYQIQPNDIFFVALGDPKWRKHYADIIESHGGHFMTIICDDALVTPNARIGEGALISHHVMISDNVSVGKHVMVHPFSILSHDVIVKDYVSLESYVFLGGHAIVGEGTMMHVRSTLLRKKRVGDNVEVGAHSVVIRNVKDGLHVFGSPAQVVDY